MVEIKQVIEETNHYPNEQEVVEILEIVKNEAVAQGIQIELVLKKTKVADNMGYATLKNWVLMEERGWYTKRMGRYKKPTPGKVLLSFGYQGIKLVIDVKEKISAILQETIKEMFERAEAGGRCLFQAEIVTHKSRK